MSRETQKMEVSWWARNRVPIFALVCMAAVVAVILTGIVLISQVPSLDEQLAAMAPEQAAAYSAMRFKLNGVTKGTVLTSNAGTRYLVVQVNIGRSSNIRVLDYYGTEHYHDTNYLAHEITEVCAPGDSCYTAACVAFALQFAD